MVERHDVDALRIVDVPNQNLNDHGGVHDDHGPIRIEQFGVGLDQRYILKSE